MVSIVIPSFGRADGIVFMVANLFHQTLCQKEPVEIIISIDDTDPERDKYIEYCKQLVIIAQRLTHQTVITLIINTTQGLVAAKNAAVEQASGDFIMMLDDDLLMEPAYIETLLHEIQTDIHIGAVSGYIVSYVPAISHTQPSDLVTSIPPTQHLQTLEIASEKEEWRTLFGQKEQVMDWSEINKQLPPLTRYTMDYFVNSYLFRKAAYSRIGGYSLSLNSKTSAHEEVDFTFRIRQAGYALLFNPFVAMWHITVGHGGIYKGSTYAESKQILEAEYKSSVPLFLKSVRAQQP